MFGRAVVLKSKTFHSIVIVIPLQISNFYRVIKKLPAWLMPQTLGTVAVILGKAIGQDDPFSVFRLTA
jgi:hypothetical protein